MSLFFCGQLTDENFDQLNQSMRDWTLSAARGECGWICSDCCCSFPEGMPDECMHGHEGCTTIIQRDKKWQLKVMDGN